MDFPQNAGAASPRPYTFTNPSTQREVTITIDDSRDELLTDFGRATLKDRYLLPGESFQDLFARVACANSNEIVFGTTDGHAQRVYDYISVLWFMPATPVLTNSGVARGLPISCFLNTIGDSMESIAEGVNENIWLASKGGGIGTRWSDVREIGAEINGSITGKTSGIIPFIHWQDAQTLAISQGSLRRGSAAVYLDVSHPEIEEFLDIRRPTGGDPRRKALNLHHGIMISNAFMEAVLNKDGNHDWDLISPRTGKVKATINARELWVHMLVSRVETGEPYLVFEDNCNNALPEIYRALGMKTTQSNLCSEITLHTGEDYQGKWRTAVCCLSSLNMETADDWYGNERFILDVISFLDNVLENFIEYSKDYPGFDRARYAAEQERSVGLGIMGFHSYLQKHEIPFESVAAQKANKKVWEWLGPVADKCNRELALSRGECPDSAAARQVAGYEHLSPKRLTHVFSVAPTASISIICGGPSPCGEPWVANSFTQKTLSGSFNVRNKYLDAQLRRRYRQLKATIEGSEIKTILSENAIFKGVQTQTEDEWTEEQWQSITINDGSVQHLPYLCKLEKGVYRTAFEIDQRWVVQHAADRAPQICQAQSVNIFLPANVHKKDLHEVHKMGWELGLKSFYYLRSRTISKAMAVSNVAGEMPKAQIEQGAPAYSEDMVCESCQ